MNSVCFLLKYGLAQGHTPMIGLSALLYTQVKMLAEEIQEDTITVGSHVQTFGKVPVGLGMRVSMHMGCLNPGCTLRSIEHASARMVQDVLEEFAFLLIQLKSFDHCMSQQILLACHRGPLPL